MTSAPRAPRWRSLIPPVVLGVVALGLLLTVLLYPTYATPRSSALDLHAGATQRMTFRSQGGGAYYGYLAMDEATARRLFPCAVDPERRCEHGGLPFALDLALMADGRVVDRRQASGAEVIGGRYGGAGAYWVMLGSWDLEANRDYTLVIRSLKDGSALFAARPYIAIEVDPGKLDAQMVSRALGFLLALMLGAAALVWAVAALIVGLRRHRRGAR